MQETSTAICQIKQVLNFAFSLLSLLFSINSTFQARRFIEDKVSSKALNIPNKRFELNVQYNFSPIFRHLPNVPIPQPYTRGSVSSETRYLLLYCLYLSFNFLQIYFPIRNRTFKSFNLCNKSNDYWGGGGSFAKLDLYATILEEYYKRLCELVMVTFDLCDKITIFCNVF